MLVLDLLVGLAFLATLLATMVARGLSGPEGPVGAWLLGILPCFFTGVLLVLLVRRGLLSFVPGGRALQTVLAAGILVSLGASFFASLGGKGSLLSHLASAVPYLALVGCLAAIHGPQLREPRLGAAVAALLLGGTSLAGWAVAGTGLVLQARSSLEASASKVREEDRRERERESEEVSAYRALPADAPLSSLLRYAWSRNGDVQKECRQRVASWPGLDETLIELLGKESEDVVAYVALVQEAPSARLAPAWGAMLDRQLKRWDVRIQDENAGTWELNLRPYFDGARKIQRSGGDLRPSLRAWYELLSRGKGLEGLAAEVKALL